LLHRPFQAVTPTLDGSVLQVLAGADARFSVSTVTTLIGDASSAGIRKALNRLVSQGLVTRESDGVAHLYRLNREHLLASPVLEIARAREALRERVVDYVSEWPVPPRLLALFGSAARGEMHLDSDLDLLVVADDPDDRWLDELSGLCGAMSAWTGNDTRPLLLTPHELATDEPVVAEIGRDAKVLFGDATLLRHARHLAARAGAA
jgi:predicted nucleotidyltransferase